MKRIYYAAALKAETTHQHDYISAYVGDLAKVIDMAAIKSAGLRIGIDPLGGAAVGYWGQVADRYGLDITVVNPNVDPTFSFMTVDRDGKIRMDCSSPYAMASLVRLKDKFDIAFANDPDSDRHGIVTPVGRADEPEPLSRRGDRVSPAQPAEVAKAAKVGQDARLQQPD